MRAFMKLAGGASRLYAEMDPAEFLQQIRAYEDADELLLNKAYKGLLTMSRTHPLPILRAQELDAWQDGYRRLMGPTGTPGCVNSNFVRTFAGADGVCPAWVRNALAFSGSAVNSKRTRTTLVSRGSLATTLA